MSGFDDYLSAPAATGPSGFDSYLGAPQAAPVAPAAASQPGILASMGAGLSHGISEGALGLEQTFGNLFGKLVNPQAGQMVTNNADSGLKGLNSWYSPYQSANPTAAAIGNLTGQVVATAPTMLIGPEYAALSLPGKIALSAGQGAAAAGMMPVDDPNGDFDAQKAKQVGAGALLGAALPTAAKLGSALARNVAGVVRPVLSPGNYVGEGLAGSLSPQDAQAVAGGIRGAQTFVPGSVPTTAQVAGNPMLVQTEKSLANANPNFKQALAQRGIDNNTARWQALMGVAQTPEALATAKQVRTDLSGPLYDAAHAQTANVGPAFMRYAQIPEMQQAMNRANSLASLDAAVGRGVAPVWPTPPTSAGPGSNTINGAALDYTSRALDGMINQANRDGATDRAGALAALRGKVDSWAQSYIPGIQEASNAYSGASVPINTMEAGQQIANTLGTRAMNAGGIPQIELSGYRTALGKALNGQPYGIESGALGTLQGIGQDLQRQTISNGLRTPGSDTTYNLAANGWLARNLYGPAFGGASGLGKSMAALGAMAAGHPIAGLGILGGGNKIGQIVGNRLQSRLSGLLLDPQSLLPYLDNRVAAAGQPVGNALAQRLAQYGRPALLGASTQLFNQPGN